MAIVGAIAVPHPPLIFPEVGKGEEAAIAKTIASYREAMRFVAALKPDTVVVTSPHATAYADYFHISPGMSAEGDFSRFDCPEIKLTAQYDLAFTGVLSKLCKENQLEAGTMYEQEKALDHATLIPLRFLNEVYTDYKVVRIGLSGLTALTHYRLGQLIAKTAEKLNRRVVMIASGDLSHKMSEASPYGYAEEGPVFDGIVVRSFANSDFLALLSMDASLQEKATECGLRSFQIMAGALDGLALEGGLLSYEGPFGIGYAVAAYEVIGKDGTRHFGDAYESMEKKTAEARRAGEDAYLKLARYALETRIQTGNAPKLPADVDQQLLDRTAAAFVSIYEDGRLRGCIGTYEPSQKNLAEEILENAVSAGTCDPRFAPVDAKELDHLVYSVDVLSAPEPAEVSELDSKKYGVIVACGEKRGLLLPDLEGVDTVSEQLKIAREKAGIAPVENPVIYRFTVERHE